MIVDKTKTRKYDIPHEPGQYVELVALTGKEMDNAKSSAVDETLSRFKPYLKDFAELQRAKDDAPKEGHEAYDLDTLLEAAVKGWSYTEMSPGPAAFALLDSVTLEWLHKTIYEENTSRPLPSESE